MLIWNGRVKKPRKYLKSRFKIRVICWLYLLHTFIVFANILVYSGPLNCRISPLGRHLQKVSHLWYRTLNEFHVMENVCMPYVHSKWHERTKKKVVGYTHGRREFNIICNKNEMNFKEMHTLRTSKHTYKYTVIVEQKCIRIRCELNVTGR